MLKILQARLQQYVNEELPDTQAGFRKDRGTRDQIVNIFWVIEKQENPRKTSASLTMLEPLTVGSQQTGKFLKRWEYQSTFSSVQLLSHVRLFYPINHSTSGFRVHHLLAFTQTHVHWVGDAIQQSLPLSSPSPALNLSQHQGLFKWFSSLHQVAKVLEFQLQYQSFQWIPRTNLL